MPVVMAERGDFRQGCEVTARVYTRGVKETSTNPWLLTVAGLVSWLIAGSPVLSDLARQPERLTEPRYLLWTAAFTLFGTAFWTVDQRDGEGSERRFVVLVAAQVLATLVAMAAFPNGIGSVLLVITASQFAWLGSLRLAVALVVAQTAAAMLVGFWGGWGAMGLLFNAGVYLGFQLFALFTSYTALKEADGRAHLARLNAELRATQDLLSESSRMAERVRLARELHDVVGHHLTALSLNLEVASHVAEGRALSHVQTSQGLAKTLLAEVRGVVSTMREPIALDIGRALELLSKDIPTPKVHINVAADLAIDDPQRAQVLLRCAQEAITNAVKHAGAKNLWLSVERSPRGVTLSARDDGRGAALLRGGNGLTGMRERLETLGGRLELDPNPGHGFALTATLPA